MENQVQQEQRPERRKRSDTVVENPFDTLITGSEPVAQENKKNASVTCHAGTFQPVTPPTQQQPAPFPGTIGY